MTTRSKGRTYRGFLLMPFDQDLEWLRDEIVRAGREVNVVIERADDIFRPGSIIEQIFESIRNADVVVAVCTGQNANVFFELGYAWHTHKAVLVAETETDLPFDVRHLRTEFYGKPSAGQDRATLPQRLVKAIGASATDKPSVTRTSQTHGRQSAKVRERINTMVHRVQSQMEGCPLPVTYVAVIPLQQYERLLHPADAKIRGIRKLTRPPVFGIEEAGAVIFPDLRPGFKRIDFDVLYQRRAAGFDWMEFYDDGSFLGVLIGHEPLQHGIFHFVGPTSEPQETRGFYDNLVTCQLVARLTTFGLLAEFFNISCDLTIQAGIANIALPVTITTGPGRNNARNTRSITAPVQTELSTDTEELKSVHGVLRTAVPLLNDLMMEFGWARCFQLEVDGTVVLNTWGRSWRTNVKRWTTANDIPVVEPNPN